MARYAIRVREILQRTVIVDDAPSLGDAIDAVNGVIEQDKLLLDCEDFNEREVTASPMYENGEVPEDKDVSLFDNLKDYLD